ncbi:uncharacterized protein LOC124963040 [Sciurus carolinensis]|uniref:uncharacterized protein LOC124963040 n=1 Tax=Sciurus carolinensis TaxID=30640 RepID=UPI001FB50C59|nr:uncharacterized protein LOC124963040 [Sciurus carolinensis]XP_047378414.1 uncharacterized protein LOC124963040 [Sciurus carolinensis]XP_047378415.1 uncharacterized protein LOC124963040 [Sciurus carolinensis]XP_047378416.1 uncharacterized protein LOC124963040 [Sciurus carolinensis]XP_047378417.1 uncharacterized protein LOC124963040 [Sciurus carolinensis]XP_047378418.1 uncharacterized protein LOC124963040 [Sciurus carolinensis]XP_047378419.1 uncharacterized protein LOC124963040 [Sciurus caro
MAGRRAARAAARTRRPAPGVGPRRPLRAAQMQGRDAEGWDFPRGGAGAEETPLLARTMNGRTRTASPKPEATAPRRPPGRRVQPCPAARGKRGVPGGAGAPPPRAASPHPRPSRWRARETPVSGFPAPFSLPLSLPGCVCDRLVGLRGASLGWQPSEGAHRFGAASTNPCFVPGVLEFGSPRSKLSIILVLVKVFFLACRPSSCIHKIFPWCILKLFTPVSALVLLWCPPVCPSLPVRLPVRTPSLLEEGPLLQHEDILTSFIYSSVSSAGNGNQDLTHARAEIRSTRQFAEEVSLQPWSLGT